MRGFWWGAGILTVAYVGVQARGAKAASGAAGLAVSVLRRLMSPDVAGLPNVSHPAPAAIAPGPFGGGGPVPLNPGSSGPATSPAPVIV